MVRARSSVDAKLRLQVVLNGECENSVRFFTHKNIKPIPTGIREVVFAKPFENSNSFSIVEQKCVQADRSKLKSNQSDLS